MLTINFTVVKGTKNFEANLRKPRSEFESTGPVRKANLLKMYKDDNIRNHLIYFLDVVSQLVAMDIEIGPELLRILLLRELSLGFKVFRCTIVSRNNELAPET